MRSRIVPCTFERPSQGVTFGTVAMQDLDLSRAPGWRSYPGPATGRHRGRPPSRLALQFPEVGGQLVRLHLVGIFALSALDEPRTTVGASVRLTAAKGAVSTIDLQSGVHYFDAVNTKKVDQTNGDGASLQTVGSVMMDGRRARVDHLILDLPHTREPSGLEFVDLGTGANFVIFDALAEFQTVPGCPFHSQGADVSLDEVGAVVRMGDRVRFQKALSQLEFAIRMTPMTLDEAKSTALTFLGVVCAAQLELGAPREMHGFLLNAARALDAKKSALDVANEANKLAETCTQSLMSDQTNPTQTAIDRALEFIDRNFAKKLTDQGIAAGVGLSTSHFRHLFKESTGQPFHKYLINLRLEKAKQFIVDMNMNVSEVSSAVGFASSAHFSRAFAQRFGCPPSSIRTIPTKRVNSRVSVAEDQPNI